MATFVYVIRLALRGSLSTGLIHSLINLNFLNRFLHSAMVRKFIISCPGIKPRLLGLNLLSLLIHFTPMAILLALRPRSGLAGYSTFALRSQLASSLSRLEDAIKYSWCFTCHLRLALSARLHETSVIIIIFCLFIYLFIFVFSCRLLIYSDNYLGLCLTLNH